MTCQRLATTCRSAISLGALASALFAGNALAQSAPAPEAGYDKDEIVVTAQKRTEKLLEVPASVSVIGAEALQNQGAKSLQDFGAYVPGLQIDSLGTPGQTMITLRGVAPVGSGTTVGTYIDDAPLGSSAFSTGASLFQLDLLPYDLTGVEVLRGPQGTLYGASTMGGLLKYSLIEANSGKFSAAAGGDVTAISHSGSIGYGARGMINLPIVSDKLAVRASAFYQRTPGFVDDVASGKRDVNLLRQSGGRVALAYTPTEAVTITLDALHQRIEAGGNAIVPLDPATQQPAFGGLRTKLAVGDSFDQTTDFYKGSLNWELDFATLTSVTSYSRSRSRQGLDITLAYGPVIESFIGTPAVSGQYLDIKVRKFNQELRLTSPSGGTLEWMLGTFYTLERSVNNQLVTSKNTDLTPNALDPLLSASLPSRYREIAGFANATVRLTDAFSVAGGVRYSHNSQTYQQFTSGAFGVGNGAGQSSEDVFTYSASAKYQFAPETMVYGRVASGYQPGGPNVAGAGIPASVGPSRLTNFEAGVKTRTFDRMLTLELVAFQINWNDIQVTAYSPPPANTGYLTNAGRARSKGFEGSATLQPDTHLTLGATLAYTDSKFIVAVPSLGVVPGTRLPHVPRVNASGTAEYSFDLSGNWTVRLGGGVRYVSSRPSSAAPPRHTEDGYAAVDLNAGLVSSDGWRFGLFAKNLFDRRAYISKQDLVGAVVLGTLLQPRTIGFSIDRNF